MILLFEHILNEEVFELENTRDHNIYRSKPGTYHHNNAGTESHPFYRSRASLVNLERNPYFKKNGALKRVPKVLLYIAENPGLKRVDILNYIYPDKKFQNSQEVEEINDGYEYLYSSSYACDLFADLHHKELIGYSKDHRIFITQKGINALKNWNLIDDAFDKPYIKDGGQKKIEIDNENISKAKFLAKVNSRAGQLDKSKVDFEDD